MRYFRLGAIALALAFVLIAPFFLVRRGELPRGSRWMAVPSTHDMRQHLSVQRQLDAAVRLGELWPRWQPEFNKGYGLPWLNYYPPGFYWLTEMVHVAIRDVLDAVFLISILTMAASGLATYALARRFFSMNASIVAALFYMITPYHLLDLYWRGALPELAGFFFVPLIVLLAHRRSIALLAIAHGAYLMTHIPVAYLLTLTLLLYAALRREIRIVIGLAWGFAIGAVYWLVALLEKHHVQDTFSRDYPYQRSYITLAEGDAFQQMLNASFVALAVALLVTLYVTRGGERHFRIIAIATMFMITPYSIYVAKLIPSIDSVSFAWRWMVIAALFISMLVAMAFERRAWIAILVLVFNLATTARVMIRAFDNPNLDAPVSYVETGFVPGRAGDPEKLPNNAPLATLSTNGRIDVVRWEPLRRELVVNAARDSMLKLRTYRFRGWTARIDGLRTNLGMDALGAQMLPLRAGTHRVVVTYENPRTRNMLAIVSAIALLAAIFGVRRPQSPL